MKRRNCLKNLLLTGIAAGTVPQSLLASSNQDFDFYFTRLSYESGNWDVDERMPANVLNSLIEYTTLRVDINERIVPLADPAMLNAPFCYMAGHRLVEFNHAERQNFETYVKNGGFVFVDDCNHDIDGVFARTFEAQMADIFGKDALKKSLMITRFILPFLSLMGLPILALNSMAGETTWSMII